MISCSKNRYLILKDGTVYKGCGFGAETSTEGEVVFTTAMNGYPESMTDPSYRGQILAITHPLVGNYGVPSPSYVNGILTNFESDRIQISGLVVSEYTIPYKWDSIKTLDAWMSEQGVPGIYDIDVRSLVKRVRNYGTIMGKVTDDLNDAQIRTSYDELDYTPMTSPKVPIYHRNTGDLIVVVDCGIKHGILEMLYKSGFSIVRVPCNYTASQIMDYYPSGVVLSNGPGNPNVLVRNVKTVSELLEYKLPIMGICLGHQLISLALGGKVEKMKFGHRGINKPVVDLKNGKCYVSTHNHGYAVMKQGVPKDTEVWFFNPDDNVVEGLVHKKLPVITTQFHPEARPGPNDVTWVFERYRKMVVG